MFQKYTRATLVIFGSSSKGFETTKPAVITFRSLLKQIQRTFRMRPDDFWSKLWRPLDQFSVFWCKPQDSLNKVYIFFYRGFSQGLDTSEVGWSPKNPFPAILQKFFFFASFFVFVTGNLGNRYQCSFHRIGMYTTNKGKAIVDEVVLSVWTRAWKCCLANPKDFRPNIIGSLE